MMTIDNFKIFISCKTYTYLKVLFQNQNLNNIKLAPTNTAWNQGSGTKNTGQTGSNSMISLSKNMYSVLENVHTDPSTLRGK